jgi:hypothetical protein
VFYVDACFAAVLREAEINALFKNIAGLFAMRLIMINS